MSRPLPDVIAHIRAVAENPAISTTLIQTEDLLALCEAAEGNYQAMVGRAPDSDKNPDQMVIARSVLRNTIIPPAHDSATGWKPPTQHYYGGPVFPSVTPGCPCPVGAEMTCRAAICGRRGPFDLPYQGE